MTGASHHAESALFGALLPPVGATRDCDVVFILGAPRTGSTLIYQAVCARFELPYIANITNELFSAAPIVGLALQKVVTVPVLFESRFGKTQGPFQPSEGSAVVSTWFGGGHPSALKSKDILPGREGHFISTLSAAQFLYGAPLVIKNAWNCFRVPYLATALPRARFIWVRRDIAAAAKSDLDARYRTKDGDAASWNSATPANVEELRKMPPAQQVVENQHAFNNAIGSNLALHAAGRWMEIWHEDFREDAESELARIGTFLARKAHTNGRAVQILPDGCWDRIKPQEAHDIETYLSQQFSRLSGNHYRLRAR